MSDPYGLADLPDPLPVPPLPEDFNEVVRVPGSKSVTNRAWICAALAEGASTLDGALRSDDTQAMESAVRLLGIRPFPSPRSATDQILRVEGFGGRVPPTSETLDVRQSGTTARFLLPMLALGSGTYRVTAHPQMQARPMAETFRALGDLGVDIEPEHEDGHLPATVRVTSVRGGVVEVSGDTSSQFLSGLLLAGPCFPDGLEIRLTTPLVSRPYVELTIRVMEAFGAEVRRPDPRTFQVQATGYRAAEYLIEPDASAASYPLAAAALCGGIVTVPGLGTRTQQGDARFAQVLEELGATVVVTEDRTIVQGSGTLRGGTFDFSDISDTAQTLAAIAPFASSPVTITGIGFIRGKEIDRLAAVATELERAGIRVEASDDGWTIHPGTPQPTTFQTYDDHRMAMSFALIGLKAEGIRIAGPGCVAKTFPGYWAMLDQLRASATDQ